MIDYSTAVVQGIYSEKACYGGICGIGHPKYATPVGPDDLFLLATGLHGKPSTQTTTVLVLDADAILQANRNTWPGTPADLKRLLDGRPDAIVARVSDSLVFQRRITGVPAGKKVVVVVGAEWLEGIYPPGSQALVARIAQLSSAAQQEALAAPVIAASGSPLVKQPMTSAITTPIRSTRLSAPLRR